MKNIKSKILFSILSFIILVPVFSFAQTVQEASTFGTSQQLGTGIVPSCTGDLIPGSSTGERKCRWEDLVTLFKRIMVYLIFIGTTLAAISVSYAGFMYATSAGNSGKIEKAHQVFSTVAVGLIFLWGGWLLIATIMSTLGVQDSFSLLNSSNVKPVVKTQ